PAPPSEYVELARGPGQGGRALPAVSPLAALAHGARTKGVVLWDPRIRSRRDGGDARRQGATKVAGKAPSFGGDSSAYTPLSPLRSAGGSGSPERHARSGGTRSSAVLR